MATRPRLSRQICRSHRLFPLLAVLVLLPAAPLLVLGARQLPPTQRLTKVAQALRSSLTKAFTPDNGAGARGVVKHVASEGLR